MAIGRRSLWLCVTALVSTAVTLGVFFILLRPTSTPVPVSFDTLMADANAGHLLDVSIHGREYTYRRYYPDQGFDPQNPFPAHPQFRATGPEPTLAIVRALCSFRMSTSERCPTIDFKPTIDLEP